MQSLARPHVTLSLFPEDAPLVATPPEDVRLEVSDEHTSKLPVHIAGELWRGSEMGAATIPTVPSGFAALDAELPGGGWPCRALTEILQDQPSGCEWRLLGPALQGIVAAGGHVILIGPPKRPHLPGLQHSGLAENSLIWIAAETPGERVWATEQLIKAHPEGAILAWLPQALPAQLRRLQVHAQSCEVPVFVFRPAVTQRGACAAPLRVLATLGTDWNINVKIVKRKGPTHEGTIALRSIPGGLANVLPPRLNKLGPVPQVDRERYSPNKRDAREAPVGASSQLGRAL